MRVAAGLLSRSAAPMLRCASISALHWDPDVSHADALQADRGTKAGGAGVLQELTASQVAAGCVRLGSLVPSLISANAWTPGVPQRKQDLHFILRTAW
jgi:hypothetical protein